MSVALAIPHTPWLPVRVESMNRLRIELGIGENTRAFDGTNRPPPSAYREFSDRESNKVWPRRLWGWGVERGADHLLQLQDDTTFAPCFWPALEAMLVAVPDHVIGLSAVHPLGPEMARLGNRFYRSQTVVGWAYVFPRALLVEFVDWVDANPNLVASRNEDDLIGDWLVRTGRYAWHPLPTIVDHDVSVASTYGNDDHSHRRAVVTWRGYDAADLSSPAWWAHNGEPPTLPVLLHRACWYCGERPDELRSGKTGAAICRLCVATLALGAMGVGIKRGAVT